MPIVEIVTFPGSDAFVRDRKVSEGVVNKLVKAEGYINAYHGLQVEDGKTGYLIIVWETYEHHAKLMGQNDYGELVESLKLSTSGDLEMQHVNFDGDSTLALSSPVTELVTFKPKTGAEEKLRAAFKELSAELIKAPSCHGVVLGGTREHKDTLRAVIGWDSIEAHNATVKDEVFKPIIEVLVPTADIEVRHASLVRVSA